MKNKTIQSPVFQPYIFITPNNIFSHPTTNFIFQAVRILQQDNFLVFSPFLDLKLDLNYFCELLSEMHLHLETFEGKLANKNTNIFRWFSDLQSKDKRHLNNNQKQIINNIINRYA